MARNYNLGLISCLLLAGCASASSVATAPARPVSCKAGPDCDAKWSRALSWVTSNSSYKFQTQSDSVVQTMGPLPDDPSPAYTVTKLATGPGIFEITFGGGCDNIFGCIPTVAESRARFADFVMAIDVPVPAPTPDALPPKRKKGPSAT